MQRSLSADQGNATVSPQPGRDDQDALRKLLQALVKDSREARILLRGLSPRQRWQLEQEVTATYSSVVVQLNALLRASTRPPEPPQNP